MKKVLLLLGAALSAYLPLAHAQIFYKVEKPGSSHATHILGTHHFAPLSAVESLPGLDSVISAADKVYGEVDMLAMMQNEGINALRSRMVAPSDSTLNTLLSQEQMDSVGSALSDLVGIVVPEHAINMLKPAAVTTQLTQLMASKIFPELDPFQGIDAVMQSRAQAAGRPVAGLETVEFQAGMLFDTPLQTQADALMQLVRDIPGEQAKAMKLSKAYLAHDLDSILSLMLESEGNDRTSIDRLIYNRNATWADQLDQEMPGASLFVVVGAGHLPGPKGLLELLKARGYEITPIQ